MGGAASAKSKYANEPGPSVGPKANGANSASLRRTMTADVGAAGSKDRPAGSKDRQSQAVDARNHSKETERHGSRINSKLNARKATLNLGDEPESPLQSKGEDGFGSAADRKNVRKSTTSKTQSCQASGDPDVFRFKVGDHVMGMGAVGKDYGLGKVSGVQDLTKGTISVKFDKSGKEMGIKGKNLVFIDQNTYELMVNMNEQQINRLIGSGLVREKADKVNAERGSNG
jgi:hypothetical protein